MVKSDSTISFYSSPGVLLASFPHGKTAGKEENSYIRRIQIQFLRLCKGYILVCCKQVNEFVHVQLHHIELHFKVELIPEMKKYKDAKCKLWFQAK